MIHRKDAKDAEMNDYPFAVERTAKGNWPGALLLMFTFMFPDGLILISG